MRIVRYFIPLQTLGLSVIYLLGSHYANAADDIEFRGFATLSASYSDSDLLGFRRDMSQEGKFQQVSWLQDSVLGLQVDTELAQGLRASVQLLAKDRVDNSVNDFVEWAYLSYEPNNHWRFRLGRIGSDLTLIGDVGNVGYAYDWVRPPVDFYGVIPFYHFDGAEVTYSAYWGATHLKTKLFYGKSGAHFVYNLSNSDFDLYPFEGLAIQLENGRLTFRAAYLYSKISHVGNTELTQLTNALSLYADYPPIAETLGALELTQAAHYFTSGLSYRFKDWTLLGEAAFLYGDQPLLPSYFATYGGVVRRFDSLAFYGLLGHTQSTEAPYQVNLMVPEPLRTVTQQIFNGVDVRQTTASLGVRWDFTCNMALKFQWDHSWVAANKALLWESTADNNSMTPAEQVNIFTLSMSVIF